MKRVDLHTHSTFSDGLFSPRQLADMAKAKGLQAMALTDHDNTDGVQEFIAACRDHGIQAVAGVEISADFEPGTMHILGLGIDPSFSPLKEKLAFLQEARRQRNLKIVDQLKSAGVDISLEEVQAEAKEGQIGRPHFATVLLAKKIVKSWEEAFDQWLGKGKPGYADKIRFSSKDSIELIHAAGGVAVLAHPVQLRLKDQALRTLLTQLVGEGLDGIEVFHSDHGPKEEQFYQILARQNGLKLSGGSDFHGFKDKDVELGSPEVDYSILEKLLAHSR